MDNENKKAAASVRYGSLDDMPAAPPLSETAKAMSDSEIEGRSSGDAGALPADSWDKAQVVEPAGA